MESDDELTSESEVEDLKKAILQNNQEEDAPLALIRTGVSVASDMKFGWKPKGQTSGAPIPLNYNFEPFVIPKNPETNQKYKPIYLGPRIPNSLLVHKAFANKTITESATQE